MEETELKVGDEIDVEPLQGLNSRTTLCPTCNKPIWFPFGNEDCSIRTGYCCGKTYIIEAIFKIKEIK